jgi:hypothetical protein
MKINPWIVVSLLALVCGFILGSRVENEAEAQAEAKVDAPKYQYFYDPNGVGPSAFTGEYQRDRDKNPKYVRVDLSTGMFSRLEVDRGLGEDGLPDYTKHEYRWTYCWSMVSYPEGINYILKPK